MPAWAAALAWSLLLVASCAAPRRSTLESPPSPAPSAAAALAERLPRGTACYALDATALAVEDAAIEDTAPVIDRRRLFAEIFPALSARELAREDLAIEAEVGVMTRRASRILLQVSDLQAAARVLAGELTWSDAPAPCTRYRGCDRRAWPLDDHTIEIAEGVWEDPDLPTESCAEILRANPRAQAAFSSIRFGQTTNVFGVFHDTGVSFFLGITPPGRVEGAGPWCGRMVTIPECVEGMHVLPRFPLFPPDLITRVTITERLAELYFDWEDLAFRQQDEARRLALLERSRALPDVEAIAIESPEHVEQAMSALTMEVRRLRFLGDPQAAAILQQLQRLFERALAYDRERYLFLWACFLLDDMNDPQAAIAVIEEALQETPQSLQWQHLLQVARAR